MSTTINLGGLDQLLKALKQKPPRARVGILGDTTRTKTGNENEAPTNAEVGAAHEFGAPARGLPQRSFLRVPLYDHLNEKMAASGAFDKATLKEVIKSGTVTPWLRKVAVLAEGIVRNSFSTGGDGKWPAWKNGYTNNTGQLLVDTTQLRDSITSEVKE